MNLYFPRIDHTRGKVLAVYRFPGEKMCARIAVRPMSQRLVEEIAPHGAPCLYEATEHRGGRERRMIAYEMDVLAILGAYYDSPESAIQLLRTGRIGSVRTQHWSFRALYCEVP